MTNGIFLGGVAQGLQQGGAGARAEDTLALQERGQEFREEQTLETRKQQAIQRTAQLAADVIKASREAGNSPEKTNASIGEILNDLTELGAPAGLISGLQAQAQIPAAAKQTSEDKAIESARAKFAGEQETQRLQTEAGQATAEDQDELFGVKVPPVTTDINAFDAPVQKALFDAQKKAVDSQQLLDELQVFKSLVETAQTGQISALTFPVRQFFLQAGIKIDDQVPIQEALVSAQNKLALRLRNPDSGFGLTGNTSDRDVTFLKAAVGGLENTPQGNQAAVITQIAMMRRQADLAALNAELLARGAPQLFSKIKKQFIDQTPLFTPEEAQFLESLKAGGQAEPTVIDGVRIRRIR